MLAEPAADGKVRCLACAHQCLIPPEGRGICQMRVNQEGQLQVPWGYVAGLNPDPIEKKPFNHFLPGTLALTFGTLGCNFHCAFCQNWFTSQTLRDPACDRGVEHMTKASAEQIVNLALANSCKSIISSYNEPLISSEWAVEIFSLARQKGLKTGFVSNGFATPQAIEYLRPHLDAYKIDLKSMRDASYHSLGGKLQPVLDTIRRVYEAGIWLEIVTLLIPGFNDQLDELWEAARFLVSVSPDIPWHITGYHPDYQYNRAEATQAKDLLRAAEIGQEAGLRYVYAGNLPGRVGSLENTYCPQCQQLLVERRGYRLGKNELRTTAACPACQTPIAGIWA